MRIREQINLQIYFPSIFLLISKINNLNFHQAQHYNNLKQQYLVSKTIIFSSLLKQKLITPLIINAYSLQTQMCDLQQSMRPQFHYHYKSDSQSIILDTQYNYQGNILALSNSQGYILLYAAENQDTGKQPYFIYEQEAKKQLKNNAILKLAWSHPQLSFLASCSIYQHITLYKFKNRTFSFYKELQADTIPVYLTFLPSQVECLLAVGFSDGALRLYNSDLQVVESIQAHFEVVNCLAWDLNLYKFQKNKWVENNFSNLYKTVGKAAYLLSCSSDGSIKLWRWMQNKMRLLGTVEKAHQKHVRMVDWKLNFFNQEEKIFASCSEDHTVKIWSVKILQDKCIFTIKGSTMMKGPVYKAKYNYIGNLIAISYCNEEEQKVETKIFKEINGTLCQQLKIQN